jgi:prophage tail gpP-like protein
MTEEVKLRVNGIDFGGWLDVEITAGIERQARDFKLGITRTWPGATDIPRRVKAGDVCEVFIGNDKMLTGYVDATPISYGSKSLSVGVTGRSKTADLIDCSATHKTGQWRGVKIERIASDLAAPYGIKVLTEIDTGTSISDHQIDTGETAFESIGRLLAIRQLLSTDNANGELVFINAASGGKAVTSLEYGKNILNAETALDYKDVFSEYTSKGQRAGNDEDYADAVAGVVASIKDSTVTRYRNLIVQQTGNATALDCQQRVKYERVYRHSKALETTYTVQGWRQQNGALWLPNQMVHVNDPVIGFDGDLLIVEVSYRIGSSGTTCSLRVAPKEGYIPSPETTKKDKAKKSGTSSGKSWLDEVK